VSAVLWYQRLNVQTSASLWLPWSSRFKCPLLTSLFAQRTTHKLNISYHKIKASTVILGDITTYQDVFLNTPCARFISCVHPSLSDRFSHEENRTLHGFADGFKKLFSHCFYFIYVNSSQALTTNLAHKCKTLEFQFWVLLVVLIINVYIIFNFFTNMYIATCAL